MPLEEPMSGQRYFVVERLNWRPCEGPADRAKGRAKKKQVARALLPGGERVTCFDDAGEADADCWRREALVRAGVNPFACGAAFCYLTGLDEGRLGDWVQDAGLTPPAAPGLESWREWWAEREPAMTELQRARVWEALDRVRFFRVVEAPRRVLFVVAGAYWHYNDQFHYRDQDGLTPYTAFRTREQAEADRLENEEMARDMMELHPFQINGLCDWSAWSSLPQEEAVERVTALGLPAPGPGYRDTLDWEGWWDEQQEEMTGEQESAVWDLLDKIRFYEVVEIEFPD
jgi:hypothetical protein